MYDFHDTWLYEYDYAVWENNAIDCYALAWTAFLFVCVWITHENITI